MSDELLREIFNAGCVRTLYQTHQIERRLVGRMAIEDAALFYEMKAEMHMPYLASFHWCGRTVTTICSSYAAVPRVCTQKRRCALHKRCIVCHSTEHLALLVYNGEVVSQCPTVQRMRCESEILMNNWKVCDAQLWRFFDGLSL